jgi:hypothetical protein
LAWCVAARRLACVVAARIAIPPTTGYSLAMTAPPSKRTAVRHDSKVQCTTSSAAPIMDVVMAVPLAGLTSLGWITMSVLGGADGKALVMVPALGFLGFSLSASKGFDNVERCRNPRRGRGGHASRPTRGYSIAEMVMPEADRQLIAEHACRELRNAGACYGLGKSYEAGLLGFEVNEARSQVCLTMACELGHTLACKSESP